MGILHDPIPTKSCISWQNIAAEYGVLCLQQRTVEGEAKNRSLWGRFIYYPVDLAPYRIIYTTFPTDFWTAKSNTSLQSGAGSARQAEASVSDRWTEGGCSKPGNAPAPPERFTIAVSTQLGGILELWSCILSAWATENMESSNRSGAVSMRSSSSFVLSHQSFAARWSRICRHVEEIKKETTVVTPLCSVPEKPAATPPKAPFSLSTLRQNSSVSIQSTSQATPPTRASAERSRARPSMDALQLIPRRLFDLLHWQIPELTFCLLLIFGYIYYTIGLPSSKCYARSLSRQQRAAHCSSDLWWGGALLLLVVISFPWKIAAASQRRWAAAQTKAVDSYTSSTALQVNGLEEKCLASPLTEEKASVRPLRPYLVVRGVVVGYWRVVLFLLFLQLCVALLSVDALFVVILWPALMAAVIADGVYQLSYVIFFFAEEQ